MIQYFFLLLLLAFPCALYGQQNQDLNWSKPQKRLLQIKEIDSIASLCSDTTYKDYLQGRKINKNDPAKAVLSVLDNQVYHILKKLSKPLSNKEEVVLWQIFNMGYIVQTNRGNIGIDIHCRDAKRFAKYIDALLITHSHFDHYRGDLNEEMKRLQKPVISNWVESGYKTDTVQAYSIGNFKITTHLGDHFFWKKESSNDMMMFEIETCGVKIVHTGDNSSTAKLARYKNVDAFILHHDIIKSLPEAVSIVQPKLTVLSHIMELGHPRTKNGYRWTYAHALEKSMLIPDANKAILFWGESILLK